jgi:hypothetical protein
MVEGVGSVNDNKWRDFLLPLSNGTIYHIPEWKTVLEKTFDDTPHYFFATDTSRSLIGWFPLFPVRRRSSGNRLCSVPFSHECGYLGDTAVCTALAVVAIAITRLCHIDTTEIRNSPYIQVFSEFMRSVPIFCVCPQIRKRSGKRGTREVL